MSRPGIAHLLAGPADDGRMLLTGTVRTWNATDGFTVAAGGAVLTVTTVLASVGNLSLGDVVAVLRYKTTVLILGKITTPS